MPPDQAGSPLTQMLPFLLIFGVFYFLMIRPEQQKQKERKEKVAKLAKNDQVVTIGGIHGTIVNVKDQTVVVRIDDNVKVELDKESVATVKQKTS